MIPDEVKAALAELRLKAERMAIEGLDLHRLCVRVVEPWLDSEEHCEELLSLVPPGMASYKVRESLQLYQGGHYFPERTAGE